MKGWGEYAPFIVTNCYEKLKGWGVSGYFSYITPKIFIECFSFSLSGECSMVPGYVELV